MPDPPQFEHLSGMLLHDVQVSAKRDKKLFHVIASSNEDTYNWSI